MTLYLRTASGKEYHINEYGQIIRLDRPGFRPSGEWRMEGLRHVRMLKVIPLPELWRAYGGPDGVKPDLLYKNGKPQWSVVDYDHGTYRIWGDRVVVISVLESHV